MFHIWEMSHLSTISVPLMHASTLKIHILILCAFTYNSSHPSWVLTAIDYTINLVKQFIDFAFFLEEKTTDELEKISQDGWHSGSAGRAATSQCQRPEVDPDLGCRLCRNLHILPVIGWFSSGCSGYVSHLEDVHVWRSISLCELPPVCERSAGWICWLLQSCRWPFLTPAGILPHCNQEQYLLVNALMSILWIQCWDTIWTSSSVFF